MKCRKFQKEIERFLEGEMEGADKALLEKHLSGCSVCADFMREAREEVSLYREALSGFRLRESLKESVLSRLRLLPELRRGTAVAAEVNRWHIFSVSAAAAAALFILAFWVSSLTFSSSLQPAVQAKRVEEPRSAFIYETQLVKVYWNVVFAPYRYYGGEESVG